VAEIGDLLAEERGISVGVMYPGEHDPLGIPLVKVGDMAGSILNPAPEFRISPAKHEEYKRTALEGGELLLTLVGGLGQCAVVPKQMAGWNAARAVAVVRLMDPTDARYLRLCLLSQPLQYLMNAWANTTVQATLNLKEIRQLPVPWPPKPERDAIASVLGALDDKIELNRRMNETLEAMTQALFKCWFVDPIQEGLLKGWRSGTFGEVAENPRRGIQPDEISSSTPYIGLEHMPRRCISLPDWGHAEELESNKFEFKADEILFGKLRPYFHKVGVAPVDGVCSTDILVVRPKAPEWFGFVLGHVSSVELINHTNAASTGTKMPRTNWNDIARFEVALPPESAAAEFTDLIRPMIERIIANIHESRTLAELRDALLPKLLSGELPIPTVARAFENSN
jgi:type I restriction enzyme S subunit